MSTWDEEERESFMIFGVPFKGTARQCREILKKFRASAAYQEWHKLDELTSQIRITTDPVPEPRKGYGDSNYTNFLNYADNNCRLLAAAESTATNVLCDIIDKVTKES